MKRIFNYIFAGLVFFAILFNTSCSSDSSDKEGENDTTIVKLEEKMNKLESDEKDSVGTTDDSKLGKEYTAKYICPDHCKGSGSDKPGDCQACGMELIENPAYVKN